MAGKISNRALVAVFEQDMNSVQQVLTMLLQKLRTYSNQFKTELLLTAFFAGDLHTYICKFRPNMYTHVHGWCMYTRNQLL
jgi:hypothetical protein